MADDRDRFGMPRRLFGVIDDEFFGAVGRVTAVAALLEGRYAALVHVADGCPEYVVANESRSSQNKRLTRALKVRRDEMGQTIPGFVDGLRKEVDEALDRRHAVAHSVWPNPTLDAAWGWRSGRERTNAAAVRETRTNREWFHQLITDLSDLVAKVGRAIDAVGCYPPPPRT